MAIRTPVYQPTPSQWASAAIHLEQRKEWRTVRINGERYVVLQSGCSGRTYIARADAAGCSCLWYCKTLSQCSHMLAIYCAATLDELAEEQDRLDDEIDAAIAEVCSEISWDALRREMPACAAGCGSLADEGRQFCTDCSAKRARDERLAAARRRVMETIAPFTLNPLAE